MIKKNAVNWNKPDDFFTKTFWDQNIRQFWQDEEIPLSDDKITWNTLTAEEKFVYTRVLGGLTLLDTEQGATGMPKIALAINDLQKKAVLSFMGFMEHMHAKSYSSIFSTVCTADQIDEIFLWVDNQTLLQNKIEVILDKYNNITDNKSLYLALVASVFLESFLFYSGFFYPLYLSGQGKMVNSGEVINLIIRDEAIHGVYVGMLGQEVKEKLSSKEQSEVAKEVINMLEQLFKIEQDYTKQIYGPLGLTSSVEVFVKYNADKALMNLAEKPVFNVEDSDINAMVLSGMSVETKNHDFFSTKGNGYIKSTKVVQLDDDDFDFS